MDLGSLARVRCTAHHARSHSRHRHSLPKESDRVNEGPLISEARFSNARGRALEPPFPRRLRQALWIRAFPPRPTPSRRVSDSARICCAAYQIAPPSLPLTHAAAGAPCSQPHAHTHAAFRSHPPRRLSTRAAIPAAHSLRGRRSLQPAAHAHARRLPPVFAAPPVSPRRHHQCHRLGTPLLAPPLATLPTSSCRHTHRPPPPPRQVSKKNGGATAGPFGDRTRPAARLAVPPLRRAT